MPLVTGRVQDGQKQPIANALIAIESGSVPSADIAFLTNNDGFFSLHLPRGHFCLSAHSEKSGKGLIECVVADSDISLVIQLGT